ncbi:MAG: hypothetical protein JWP34_4552 [Massilia sp.]|jgi:hypothetical protein|nr:hypothetical protein [Massilia sp.]
MNLRAIDFVIGMSLLRTSGRISLGTLFLVDVDHERALDYIARYAGAGPAR